MDVLYLSFEIEALLLGAFTFGDVAYKLDHTGDITGFGVHHRITVEFNPLDSRGRFSEYHLFMTGFTYLMFRSVSGTLIPS